MCGIAGIVTLDKHKDIEHTVDKMLGTIVHRGPDGCGIRTFNDKVCLGHRRLAIIDLSNAGMQPMDYDNQLWITFNGEIYNYLELRRELEREGYSFKTLTDTEVLLAAYDKWGELCVSHFNGMWAFAIYDVRKEILFCSRDRYGVKPFYYEINGSSFIFGSEIKEIIATREDGNVKANKENLEAFLLGGLIDSNECTMFENIKQLVGGDNLVVDCTSLALRKYTWYDLTKVKVNNKDKLVNCEIFKGLFFDSIDLRLRSDVPVGSCLSGGLDSSSIVCAIHHKLKENGEGESQYTVSSCFEDKRYDEQEYIDAVVQKTGVTSYKVFPDMGDVFAELDNIIWHMDEPFGGTSVFAQWNVFKTAKEKGLTVMLDGQGADEQLAGYTPFYKVLFLDLFKKKKFNKLIREVNAFKKLRAESEVVKTWELLASVILTACCPNRIRILFNNLFQIHTKGLPFPRSFYNNALVKAGWYAYDKRNPQKYINEGLHNGIRELLHYEDRDSMAHSIESRVPFLDYRLVEFIFSIPFEQKIEDGKTKDILREGLKEILPKEIYSRYTKLGFVTPEDQWLKDNEDLFYKELSDACDVLYGIINKEQVLRWYKANVQKTRRGDSTCFRIICAAHWAKIFNVVI